MAYVISDACISCGACEAECPVEAISQGDEHYVIDPEKCKMCIRDSLSAPVGGADLYR